MMDTVYTPATFDAELRSPNDWNANRSVYTEPGGSLAEADFVQSFEALQQLSKARSTLDLLSEKLEQAHARFVTQQTTWAR